MATRKQYSNVGYTLAQGGLNDLYPLPIVATRAPTTADQAQIGTIWVNRSANIWYILTSVVANSANWISVTSPGGAITGTSLSITGAVTLSGVGQGVMQTSAAGVVSGSIGTNGQLLIGNSGNNPAWGNITSTGGTIGITNGAGTINLETSGSGIPWNSEAGVTVNAGVNNAYVLTNAGTVTVNLPANFAVGDRIIVMQVGASGSNYVLDAAAGDVIRIGAEVSSAGGTMTTRTDERFSNVTLVGAIANTTWVATSFIGTHNAA